MLKSKKLVLLAVFVQAFMAAMAQSPQQFAYQAVVRDNNNQLVGNRTIGMRVSILRDSTNGQSAYTETQSPKTNQQGIVQLHIGGGTVVSGSFATVPWSSGRLFVKTEMDLQGGTNYTISGTTQLLSVPYAMYSSNVPVSKAGDTVTIGSSKLIIPGSQLLPGTAPASLSNGLVAYYPFNGNAMDESGNGNHGTVNGANLTSDRKGGINQAYKFSASLNTAQSITGSKSITTTRMFSISYWLSRDILSHNEFTWHLMLTASNSTYEFFSSNNNIVFRNFGGWQSYFDITSQIPFQVNKHFHICVTSDSTVTSLFINGVLSNKTNAPIQIPLNAELTFGKHSNFNPSGITGFSGILDDIRIYNRALTQEEITYLANN